MNLDILAFAAHPDDVELAMGGTIVNFTKNKLKVGIIDFTQGELGTRGTKLTRKNEANDASKILGITVRENLKFPDGNVFENKKNTLKIISKIRQYKPKLIFAPYFNDRHPDHIETSKIVKRAMFLAGLPKIKTELKDKLQNAYRPSKLFYYMQTYEFQPSFIVDISKSFETKMNAVRAYKTQFYIEGINSNQPETFISNPQFIKYLKARAQTFGFAIRKNYGEPFFCEEAIELDLTKLLEELK
jgi:bacillithiol biosynthesis deacetylase BshB1